MNGWVRNGGRFSALVVSGVVLGVLVASPASASAPAKKSKAQSLTGTITWSKTTITTYLDEGDPVSGTWSQRTTTESATLKVSVRKDPAFTRTYVLKRTKVPYSSTMKGWAVSDDYSFEQVVCTTTTNESAAGKGKVAVAPHVFGRFNPNKDVPILDRRTKGISLPAVMSVSGTSSVSQEGSGTSPCTNGTWSDPLDVTVSTSLIDSRWVCKPKGLTKVPAGEMPLYGVWSNKRKGFDFVCHHTFGDGRGTTQELAISGFLKYKR